MQARTQPRPSAGARLEPLDPEQVEADGRADDVDDRIDGPHLVEMDLLDVDAVRGRLGLAQLEEDAAQLILPGESVLLSIIASMWCRWRCACSGGAMTFA